MEMQLEIRAEDSYDTIDSPKVTLNSRRQRCIKTGRNIETNFSQFGTEKSGKHESRAFRSSILVNCRYFVMM